MFAILKESPLFRGLETGEIEGPLRSGSRRHGAVHLDVLGFNLVRPGYFERLQFAV